MFAMKMKKGQGFVGNAQVFEVDEKKLADVSKYLGDVLPHLRLYLRYQTLTCHDPEFYSHFLSLYP